MVVPVETGSSISVVEISNVLDRPTSANVRIHSSSGEQVSTLRVNLPAHSSYHLIANESLGDEERGLIFVDGRSAESLVVTGVTYNKHRNGRLAYVFAVPGKEAISGDIQGSYNTFLGQESEVLMMNTSDFQGTALVEARRSDGTLINLGSDRALRIPARGSYVIRINDYEGLDNYGVVSLRQTNEAELTGWVLRRNSDFLITVPLR